eukprot:Hpha_TRINITY_DN35220_c0_g1::TRINITY_DN35220_c0_g1_i1::g.145185::m.145185/K07407/E3.2.1.22B, galA, rafA; alpha-galactosidase
MRSFVMAAVWGIVMVVCATSPQGRARGTAPPPMGYSTWNSFPFKGVSEAHCVQQADELVAKGLASAGYSVFIVDEPCFVGREEGSGALLENKTAWPRGLAWFAGYLKERNMSLGIYTDLGRLTCQSCPGSAGYEELDAATFAEWGATYIKVDRCFGVDSEEMRLGLPAQYLKFKHPKVEVVSAILAGTDNCWEWGEGGNLTQGCRTTQDISNSWWSMLSNLDNQERVPHIDSYAGHRASGSYYNDLDMLLVGLPPDGPTPGPGLTEEETRSHLALWAVLKSPLLIGADLTQMADNATALLLNAGFIAVSQDSLGVQGRRLRYSQPLSRNAGVSFQSCERGAVPGQMWNLSSSDARFWTVGEKPRQCLTLGGGFVAGSYAQVCEPSGNWTCPKPLADCPEWTWGGGKISPVANSTLCLQGILGPGPTRVKLLSCADDPRQKWGPGGGGSVVASDGHCLTGDPVPNAPGGTDLYAGPLEGGDYAVVVLNRGTADAKGSFDFAEIGMESGADASVTDVWSGTAVRVTGGWTGALPPHGAAFLRIHQL